MNKKKEDVANTLSVNLSALAQINQDLLQDGVFWRLPASSLPPDLGFPQGILDKSAWVYVAATDSPEDDRKFVVFMALRVDQSKASGDFVYDAHPLATYINMSTYIPSPTGMIWHHADFPDRTHPIDPTYWGQSIPDTVNALRSHITQPASGHVMNDPFVKDAVTATLKTLDRYEQKQKKAVAPATPPKVQPAKPPQVSPPAPKPSQAPKQPKVTRNRKVPKGRRQ